MARKPRHLSAEERAMWNQVAQSLRPLDPVRKDVRKTAAPRKPVPKPNTGPAPMAMPDFRIGTKRTVAPATSIDLSPDPMVRTGRAPVNMDARTFSRMKKGRLHPDARIDLHGMTAERAHQALRAFILRAHMQGHRLVLVITGKGRSGDSSESIAPHRKGILRHAVPEWLQQQPMAQIVLQISPAHQKHGGGGAYYVYLRRNR